MVVYVLCGINLDERGIIFVLVSAFVFLQRKNIIWREKNEIILYIDNIITNNN